MADMVTFNSARQDRVLVLYLLSAYWIYILWRRRGQFVLFHTPAARRAQWFKTIIGYVAYLAAVCACLAWAILIPRPAARLKSPNPDDLIIDFHSHTSYSWDGRRVLGAFTPEANMRWHRRQGFTAAFITDHNVILGAQEGKALSQKQWKSDGYRSLEGEEISLHDTHIGVLGNRILVNNTLYNKDLAGVFRFLKEVPKYGGLPVMNLPEYWLHHPEARWEEFARRGAAGFEIVNSVPKAMDFPQDKRREVLELCRKRHLSMLGVSDNHGWGSATFVWNVMRISGQARMGPDRLQEAVLAKLRKDGPDAARVIVRTKQEPLAAPWIVADPILGVWTLGRTLSWPEMFAFLAWIWLPLLLAPFIGF